MQVEIMKKLLKLLKMYESNLEKDLKSLEEKAFCKDDVTDCLDVKFELETILRCRCFIENDYNDFKNNLEIKAL